MADWAGEFSELRAQARSPLAALDWRQVTWAELAALEDEIKEIDAVSYCAILPELVELMAGGYGDLAEFHQLDWLFWVPKTRIEVWRALRLRFPWQAWEPMVAEALGVPFDPEVPPLDIRPLDAMSERHRRLLRDRIAEILAGADNSLDYSEHPFAKEMEDLVALL